ncbi:hypothetical protein HanXRQr2_Chr16g0744471 [Helianthus annuus]|uniref:Uncharacterized protein n=1 Tax=Helianthus annuus TaxID=4232 RepID=A0A9K3GXX3_HELAN|nr:hypothetical protein HanXRQr2_Chr16g0744471 [Helianthus annuus]KAJ0820920.1 hypothetical protein HanPSC8_Chr16g0713811 [Helianthus annuus]
MSVVMKKKTDVLTPESRLSELRCRRLQPPEATTEPPFSSSVATISGGAAPPHLSHTLSLLLSLSLSARTFSRHHPRRRCHFRHLTV